MAFIIQSSIHINGKALSFYNSLSIEQDIHWHHTFELNVPIQSLLKALGKEDAIYKPLEKQFQACQECLGQSISTEFWLSNVASSQGNTFVGLVTSLSISRSYGGQMDILVNGYSPSIAMSKGFDCVSFHDMSLSDIFGQVHSDYDQASFKLQCNPKHSNTFEYIVQYKESDYHFLCRLADRYGEWFYYDGEQLCLGPPDTSNCIELGLGDLMSNFKLSMNVEPLNFKTQRYDYKQTELYEDSSEGKSVNGLGDYGNFTFDKSNDVFPQEPIAPMDFLVENKNDLETYIKQKKAMLANNLVHFDASSKHTDLRVGTVVELKANKKSSQFSEAEQYGKYIIIHISHFLDNKGHYQNRFTAIPADVEFPPVNVHVHLPQCEEQIAIVKENVEDPDNLGRIKVNFKWQKDGQMTPWIRCMTTHAGADKGIYFIPELEEDVLIGFENGDPERPYVLGSMYHSQQTPAYFKDPNNYMKAIRTVSENEIHLYDEPDKERIKIFNKSSQNEIVLSLDGSGKIRIKTKGLLEMQATDITMNASNNMSVTVGKDLSISVGENTNFSVGKDIETTIGDNATISTGKDTTITVGEKMSMHAGDTTEIKSGKDINIQSEQAGISQKSLKDNSIEATGNVTVKATQNLNLEASISAELKANATTTVSSTGPTTVKGALVNVNGQGPVAVKGAMITLN